MGFCFPLIPLFFFRASTLFSKRMQMAILAGLFINFVVRPCLCFMLRILNGWRYRWAYSNYWHDVHPPNNAQ